MAEAEAETLEDFVRPSMVLHAESIATGLEHLATLIRQRAAGIALVADDPERKYADIASDIAHEVSWGVPALNVGRLIRIAADMDMDRARRSVK